MATEPEIDTSDVQGNVIPGFFKPYQLLLGLRIEDAAAVQRFLSELSGQITSAEEVFLFRGLRRTMGRRMGRQPAADELSAVWVNVSFSADALRVLVDPAGVDQFEDEAFRIGLASRSSLLGDPESGEGAAQNWIVGGTSDSTPHLLFVIAGDRDSDVAGKANALATSAMSSGLSEVYREAGHDLPGELSGHEHFGFLDGVSQPGVRGVFQSDPQQPVTPRIVDPASPFSKNRSRPGQPLVETGQFLFGYRRQHDQILGQTLPPRGAPEWAKNGSLLVFRRLRQDVKAFWEFMKQAAEDVSSSPGFGTITDEHLASLLVGRWPNGAPVMRTPESDDARFAAEFVNNNFRFKQAGPDIPYDPAAMIPADTLPRSAADDGGFVCPHAAHIRKVNPRDLVTEQGNSIDVLQRRILRRGIPFGAVRPHRTEGDDPEAGNRGLHFLCYQTSIIDQFEFLSINWMNAVQAPEENPGGHDMILGQNPALGANRQRTATLRRRTASGTETQKQITTTTDWVTPTGGGYFFTPSIGTIRNLIGS